MLLRLGVMLPLFGVMLPLLGVMLLRLGVMRLGVMLLLRLGVMLPLFGVMLPLVGVMLLWPRVMRRGVTLLPGVMLLGTGVILNKLLSQILGQMLHLLMAISILLGQNEPGLIWLWVMLILRLWVMLLAMLVGSVWLTLQVEARVMVGRVSG